jgi:hypothetical protein
MGDEYLAAFTCGDQLLWGAAEPLRRMPRIVLESKWVRMPLAEKRNPLVFQKSVRDQVNCTSLA